MSLSAVHRVAGQGGRRITEVAEDSAQNARCFLRYAPDAARTPRYHSSPVKVGQYIVAIAITRKDRVSNAESNQSG